jgi:hypothetical protein
VTFGVRSSASAVLLILSSTSAGAADLCVKCTGPDASYDCVVNRSGPPDTVTKLYCITALAKAGPHASCAIDRNTTAPCQGERREFTIPATVDGALGGSQEQEATQQPALPPPGTEVEEPPQDTASDVPPKTVQEMVEKSAKSTGDSLAQTQKTAATAAKSAGTALEKAGSAVGSAAKTSWKCLSSFFSKC